MVRRLCLLSALCVVFAACQPQPNAEQLPTPIPFPTVTPGRLVRGLLPTLAAAPDGGSSRLANPATAVALANLPTATPDYAACPAQADPEPPPRPLTGQEATAAITRFVSDGGSADALTGLLRDGWGLLGENGIVRADLDFIGVGAPQLLLAYNAPGDGGTLLVLGCANGRYAPLYQSITGSMPQIIFAGDMTYNSRAELLFASRQCSAENPDDCAYRTLLMAWDGYEGRFINLLNAAISSVELPTASDVDGDQVLEVAVRLTSTGTSTTGPLRTGLNIYDWNGQYYALSVVQLDPPRFLVQVIHEADRAFRRADFQQAISLFELARGDTGLRFWFNDEPALLRSYTLYRLVLLYAYTDQTEKALGAFQAALDSFPPPAAPVYAEMITAFWNTFQTTNNLNSACRDVQAIITARPEAVGLLNRYGSRSPVYTAADLCPF
jgi:tetratricopeptide (TPR) repeat protein